MISNSEIFPIIEFSIKIYQWLNKTILMIKLRRMLSFSGNKCRMTLQYIEKPYGGRNRKFVQLEDAALYLRMEKSLNKIGIEVVEFGDVGFDGDEIHIGSPMLNYYINLYVLDFIKDFRWHVKEKTYHDTFKESLENMKHKNFHVFDNELNGYVISGGSPCQYKRNLMDWAFFLKLDKKHLENRHTVHAIFGIGGTIGRRGAVRYFTKHYRSIYKQYRKDNKEGEEKFKSYLYGIQLNRDGNPNGKLTLLWKK